MHVFCGTCLRACICKEMTQVLGVAHACTFHAAVRLTEDALELLIIKLTRVNALTCVKLSVTKHVSKHVSELLAVQTPKINVYLGEALPLGVCSIPFTHTSNQH